MLDLLKRHKADIVTLLRPAEDGWSAADWQAFFDERAGIVEFDGGLPRAEAEARAFACCVAEWLNRNPVRSPPGHCIGCGEDGNAHDPLVPFGSEPSGQAWLHSRCWPAWNAGRQAKAVAALATMGIMPPDQFPDESHYRKPSPAKALPSAQAEPVAKVAQAVKIIVAPAARGRYTAHFEGRLLGTFRTPFLSAARMLLAEGVDPSAIITMHWGEGEPFALRAKVGVAAKLTVQENSRVGPRFRPYRPGPTSAAED